jgi:hypothetical protein
MSSLFLTGLWRHRTRKFLLFSLRKQLFH